MAKKYSVMLVCGSGASSGFLAANIRKAAKECGLEIDARARSETEVEFYASEVDCIMIGPHIAYVEEEVKDRIEGACPVFVMGKNYYSTLDGKAAIDDMLKHLE